MLTSDRDILALGEPYDDYWFVSSAWRSIWSGQYNHMVFAQLPIYSMWLKLTALIGLPGRLAIDFGWLAATAYLATAVNRFCNRYWPGLLLFGFLAFHPYSIALFDRALSENFTAVLCAVCLGAFIDVWNFRVASPRSSAARRHMIIAGMVAAISFAAAYHSRKEGVILLVPLVCLALWSLVKRDLWWSKEDRRLALYILAAPIAATLIVGVGLAGLNAWHWGIFARYELAAPQYQRAINSLNAIDPGEPTPRWVTVTAKTRARAYAVSPTFVELKDYLEGDIVEPARRQTEASSGVKGEIGNGWFYWSLRDSAATAGWHRSAAKAELKYAAMANEIEAAFDAGKLKRRPVYISFVDPDFHKWLPGIPLAIWHELRQLIAPNTADLAMPNIEDASTSQQDAFAAIVGRRHAFPRTAIRGWIVAPDQSQVGLGTPEQVQFWSTLHGQTRPDVAGAYPFRLDAFSGNPATLLHFKLPDGRRSSISLDALKVGTFLQIEKLPGVTLGVDELTRARPIPRADRYTPFLCEVWTAAGWILAVAGLFAVFLVGHSETTAALSLRLIAIILLVSILARVFLFAVLASSSWSGEQARYLLPVVPLFAVFGFLSLWKLTDYFSGIRLHRAEA